MNQNTQLLPNKEQIKTYPRFRNLNFDKIIVINTLEQCKQIEYELAHALVLGFDTESKPTFHKGEAQTGPHLIQLATLEKAYLFQVSPDIVEFLKAIFENPRQIKVGFGLKNDAHLFRKQSIEIQGMIDLSKSFSSFGLTNAVGIKNAMALLFQVNFPKSKSVSTSNWARKVLTEAQIEYAAADAYAALLVFGELYQRKLLSHSVIQGLNSNPQIKQALQGKQILTS